MRTSYPTLEELSTLAFEDSVTTQGLFSEPALTSIRSRNQLISDLDHGKLQRRKHHKQRKRRRGRHRQTKKDSCISKSVGENVNLQEKTGVVFDGFGNEIGKHGSEHSYGDGTHEDDKAKKEEKPETTQDFSWVFSDTTEEGLVPDPGVNVVSPGTSLSQTEESSQWKEQQAEYCFETERSAIEEEIKRKCIEMEKLLSKMSSKRVRRSRRLQCSHEGEINEELYMPEFVNIQPIRRRKRIAQPIRNALLVRSAMKKAWKGVLGSCCGKGCWATWKWMNLTRVISDYE